jgi:formamidopyrimidine-DNA glycosylase
MPELPEVETIRRGLNERVVGRTITDFVVQLPKQFVPGKHSKTEVIGKKIVGLRRRGKVLIVDLDNGVSLVIHLKMTGQLIWMSPNGESYAGGHPYPALSTELPSKYSHIYFVFENGAKLFFNDQRQFGYLKVAATKEVEDIEFIRKLGPEPLDEELTLDEFGRRLRRRPQARLKPLLLDQTFLAGLGNIYVDEALHEARLHPLRAVRSLDDGEVEALYKAIRLVIQEALRWGGSSIQAFIDPDGNRGVYMKKAGRVYKRTGEECPVCGTPIERIVVAGRGTHYCPHCQRLA